MRMVAYCRVSTEHEEQLTSLKNQQDFFEEFAAKNGHTLIRLYSDEGISGKQMKNRTGFLQMLDDSRLGMFNLVVVKDISRFARNTLDFLTAIRELKSRKIEVLFLSTNQTVLGNSEFILTVFSALAQEESANLSGRVKFGKKQSAKKGKVPNFVYGYDRTDAYNLKINEEQAEVIRKIFNWYVYGGIGARRICTKLREMGIKNTKGGDLWQEKTIRRILKNPLYKGTLISRKSEGVDFITGERKALLPDEDYIFRKDEYRIINDEEFYAAQRIIEERADFYKSKNPCGRTSAAYPYSTLICCENCGYSYTRRLSRGVEQYAFWKCSGRNAHGSKFCQNKTIVLENELGVFLKQYILSRIKNFAEIEEFINIRIGEREGEREQIAEKLTKMRRMKDKYTDMYVNEIITLDELKTKTKKLCSEIKKLERRLEKETDKTEKFSVSKGIEMIISDDEYANAELKRLIRKISVSDNGEVRIEFLI